MNSLIKKSFARQKVAVATLCTVCMLFFTVSGCDKQGALDGEFDTPWEDIDDSSKVPFERIEIPYLGYSVVSEGSMSDISTVEGLHLKRIPEFWPNENDPLYYKSSKLIVINSNEALENYFPSEYVDSPGIDFAKQTLLVVCGTSNVVVHKKTAKGLVQLSANKYRVYAEIDKGSLMHFYAIDHWLVAITTSKLDEKSTVELNLKILNN
jgi:hypothetical protein